MQPQASQCDIEDPESEFGKPIFRKLLEDQMKQTTHLQIENSGLLDSLKQLKKKIQRSDEQQQKLEKFYSKMKTKKYRNCGVQV